MKNILLLLHDDSGQEARLQVGLHLARALDGHLCCLDVVQAPVQGGCLTPDGQVFLVEYEREQETANRGTISNRLENEDVPWTMTEATGNIADCVKRAAGLSDLIVVNRRLDDFSGPDMMAIASKVVLEAHKPVVAVSEACRSFDAAGPAIVAWDGSDPAMAALTGSVPLLRIARSVKIIEIQDSTAGSVRDASAYLSRHDIHAEVELIARFKGDPDGPAEIIQAICVREKAAYCVMGAFGHSRLREAILGGVTRTMLASSEVPLVLAH